MLRFRYDTELLLFVSIMVLLLIASVFDGLASANEERLYCEGVYSGMMQDWRGNYDQQCYMGKVRTTPRKKARASH